MPYNKPYPSGFQDYPDTTTPINANALNIMDSGIKTANDQFQTVTTVERLTLTPSVGQTVWDSTLKQLMVYVNTAAGNAWQPVGNAIVCASTTRPSSPFEGQLIYETDTQRWLSYDGSAWSSIVDTDVWSMDGDYFQGSSANSAQPRIYLTNTTNDSQNSFLSFFKKRGTNIVNSGDISGGFLWYAYTGVADSAIARVRAVVEGTPSATSMGGRLEFSTALDGTSGSAVVERMRINNAGVVFIGNGETAASPSAGTIAGTGASGTNIAGAVLNIRGGASTGNASGGSVILATTPVGATGSSANPYRPNLSLTQNGIAYFGDATAASPRAADLRSEAASGTDVGGANFVIQPGAGTGSGTGGNFVVNTAVAGASGSSLNPQTERFRITQGGTVYIGNGTQNASPINALISGTGGSGTDINGANVTIAPGQSTGTGTGGAFVVQTAPSATASGSALNTLVERMRITPGGVVIVGPGATNASPTQGNIRATGGSGTNIGGASLTLDAGAGTGNANGGYVEIRTAPGGASGSTLNSYVQRMQVDANGFTSITNGSFGRSAPVSITAATYTVATNNNWLIANFAGTVTLTIPAASAWTGREIMVKTITANTVISASSNVVPLAGGAAGTAILAATAGKWATLVSDGTNWITMAAA